MEPKEDEQVNTAEEQIDTTTQPIEEGKAEQSKKQQKKKKEKVVFEPLPETTSQDFSS